MRAHEEADTVPGSVCKLTHAFFPKLYRVGKTIIISIFLMRKLRHRAVKGLAQDLTLVRSRASWESRQIVSGALCPLSSQRSSRIQN